MITSDETAKDLVNRYLQIYDGRVPQAKECATIAVDLIIKEYNRLLSVQELDDEIYYQREFWNDVKFWINQKL